MSLKMSHFWPLFLSFVGLRRYQNNQLKIKFRIERLHDK